MRAQVRMGPNGCCSSDGSSSNADTSLLNLSAMRTEGRRHIWASISQAKAMFSTARAQMWSSLDAGATAEAPAPPDDSDGGSAIGSAAAQGAGTCELRAKAGRRWARARPRAPAGNATELVNSLAPPPRRARASASTATPSRSTDTIICVPPQSCTAWRA